MTVGETEAPKLRRMSQETADRAEVRKALTSIVRQLRDLRRESALLTVLLSDGPRTPLSPLEPPHFVVGSKKYRRRSMTRFPPLNLAGRATAAFTTSARHWISSRGPFPE